MKRLKQLEQENARLEKMVAERHLELDVTKEINAKKWCARPPACMRESMGPVGATCARADVARAVSVALRIEKLARAGRACARRNERTLSAQYPSYGYRRIQIFLGRRVTH
ncbi:hypothetical protein PPGU19_086420 (plasmid) [Paraburkholderia sp. PGU19]|nr:hypothetical protein PPGU19_086420 [Paraburkholderia sp. PGU19]